MSALIINSSHIWLCVHVAAARRADGRRRRQRRRWRAKKRQINSFRRFICLLLLGYLYPCQEQDKNLNEPQIPHPSSSSGGVVAVVTLTAFPTEFGQFDGWCGAMFCSFLVVVFLTYLRGAECLFIINLGSWWAVPCLVSSSTNKVRRRQENRFCHPCQNNVSAGKQGEHEAIALQKKEVLWRMQFIYRLIVIVSAFICTCIQSWACAKLGADENNYR